MHFNLSSLTVWIRIVNTYSEIQVNIFSNNSDITKCQSFWHDAAPAANDTKAIAIPQVLSENNQAKNVIRMTHGGRTDANRR